MPKQFIEHVYKRRVAYVLSIIMMVVGLTLFLTSNSFAADVSSVVLSDPDTTGYGLDGRDFKITWNIATSTPAGYQYTKVFITSSTLVLTTSTLNTACNGGSCVAVGLFNQYNIASTTLPQSSKLDSLLRDWSTTTPYIAWVYIQSDVPTIVSSSPINAVFDAVADTSAPQIDHMGVHTAQAGAMAVINSFIIDDQTTAAQFANTGDGGPESFKLFYGTDPTVSVSSVDAVPVSSTLAVGLFSFTIPTSSVVNQLKYYLIARDASNNVRYFCAAGFSSGTSTCQSSPFTIATTTLSSRSVSGKVTSNGNNVANALVFPGGFAKAAVFTDSNGDYTVSGLPDNNTFNFTANKTNFTKTYRLETVGTANKTGVNMILNPGAISYIVSTDPSGGGGAPKPVFSGPPDSAQNVPADVKIRVGFDQVLNATTVSDADASDSSSSVYLTKNDGIKIAGTVTYCANSSAPGCSVLPSMDNNVILFSPSANLATGTFYTLVINEAVKSNGGQSISGNRAGGGHKVSFTTMGNSFSTSHTDTATWQNNFNQGGQYMPPFVKSMIPAPGMIAAPNVNILLEFNQAMDSNSINTTNVTLWKNGSQISSGVAVTLDSNEKRFVTITHNYASDGTGEYEVKVKGAVSSASGVPMRTGDTSVIAFSSKFTVSGSNDSTAPTLYPALANNSTAVPTNKIFEVGLSEQLSFTTVNSSNILLGRGSSNESFYTRYDPGKNSIFIVPTSVLIPNTVYTVMLLPSITDLAGNAIATTTYTYTTGGTDSTAPGIKEARCDDYTCKITFNESMNHDSQSDSKWAASVLNPTNWTLKKTAPTTATVNISAKPINYDLVNKVVTIEGISGLVAGDTFMVTTSLAVTDISDNVIESGLQLFTGKVESSKTTFGSMGDMGMFAPPTAGITGGSVGGTEFKPQGFGTFTADQFALGQADMAFPFNSMAGVDSNVFQVRFTPGVVLATGDVVTLTFPDGFNVANAALDTQSPFYSDFNQFSAGLVSSTAVSVANELNEISVTLAVSGSPLANDPITIDLKKIINSSIPKGPQTGGYTVGIKVNRSNAIVATKTSMPFFIMSAGSNTLVVDVVAGSSTSSPASGANGTVYIHGGGPGGPMDKKLTLTNGDISAVDGTSGTAVTYSSLPDGCYFVGTDPFVTLGSSDYFGQMSPEPICLNSGETKTKWLLLTSASGGSTATLTVKMVDSNGNPYNFGGKDIDIFAGGPNKFVVKNLTGVTTAATNGYNIKLNADGHWFVGMGPGMPKGGTTGAKPGSLGVMPPPPVDIVVKNIATTPVLSLGTNNVPPGVSYSNGVVTFSFSTADKTVSGTVKDGSGNALSNVEVFMHRQGFGTPVFTQTNASGTFSLSLSSFGNYEIGAMSDGMPPVMKNIELRSDNKIYVDGKDVTGNLILTLKKSSYTISGKVLDGSSNGISYAPVMAIDANGNTVFGQTSSDGSYTLFVENGTWTVRSELPPSKTDSCGTFSKVVTVSGASQASQNLTSSVSACFTLSGTVTVGSALANVPLFIQEWNTSTDKPVIGGMRKGASTDSSGAYSVKLGAGTYRVGSWHPDYGELSATVTVSANTTQNLTVASTQNITFSFTGGTSTMNGFIELKNSADNNKRVSRQLSGLNNSAVFAVPSGSTYSYFLDVFGVGKFQGTVAAGATETVNLGSSSDYITVTGTIYTDASTSTGKSGALVTFANATTTVSAVADSNGQYSLKLKSGTYTVSDSLSGYTATKGANVTFSTSTSAYDFGGANPDQIALQTAGYNIEGIAYASDGSTPMTDGYVWATNASGTVATAQIKSTDGTYSLPVTNGVWTVKAVGPRHIETVTSTITVSSANQTAKNITLTAAAAGANVPTSTTGVVAADTGGSINDSSGSGIKLTVGAGVLATGSDDIRVDFEKSSSAPDTSNFSALGNTSFSITASGDSAIKNLSGSAEIQLDYTSLLTDLPAGVSESDLKLTYYSEEKGDYVPVEGGFTVDTSTNKITGLVSHFTDFVITYTATSTNAPSAPTGLTATAASASQINLTWTAVSGATSYTVYRSTDNVTFSSIATPSTNSYSSTGLTASTLYYYKVTATNGSGESSSSDVASATTQTAAGGGGGSGSGSGSGSSSTPTTNTTTTTTSTVKSATSTTVVASTTPAVAAPVATTTVKTITPATPAVPASPAVSPVVTSGGSANPSSKIIITLPTVLSYNPGSLFKFNYQYKNEGVKKVQLRVVRQLLNSQGKVVKTSSLNKVFKAKELFKSDVKENLLKNLKPGEYTVKIMIMGAKNKVLDQNSFKIQVDAKSVGKKADSAKKKHFVLGAVASEESDILFNAESLAKISSNVILPTTVKMTYSFTNSSDQNQKVRMVRELVGPNGKVVESKTGNWNMEGGEEGSQSFAQPVVPNFADGAYKIRIRAYEFKTKELLAENSIGFSVESK